MTLNVTVTGWRPAMTDGVKRTDEIVRRSVSGTLDAAMDVSPLGSFVVPGGGGGVVDETGPTVFERAVVLPALSPAVTAARMSWPASDAVSVYVVLVAPEIETQLFPLESHRCHWYA